jgi:hypothetical protein
MRKNVCDSARYFLIFFFTNIKVHIIMAYGPIDHTEKYISLYYYQESLIYIGDIIHEVRKKSNLCVSSDTVSDVELCTGFPGKRIGI